MIFKRQKYIDQLVAGQGNGLVKIVTGGRRCGKSFLLFTLFHQHLKEQGVSDDHIIELSLDDRRSKPLRNPDALLDFIDERVKKDGSTYYVIWLCYGCRCLSCFQGYMGAEHLVSDRPSVKAYLDEEIATASLDELMPTMSFQYETYPKSSFSLLTLLRETGMAS